MNDQIFPGEGVFEGSSVHAFTTSSSTGLRFAVLYGDASADYLQRTPIDAALAEQERASIASTHGTLVDSHPAAVAGRPGRELRLTAGSKAYAFRLVFVRSRLYSISVTGALGQVDQGEGKVFLDSFAVDE
jgi:hypothetical protein